MMVKYTVCLRKWLLCVIFKCSYISFSYGKFIVSMKREDPFSCPICLESLTNTGVHRPACLKCGHIFGEQCLEKWIRVIFVFNHHVYTFLLKNTCLY